MAASSVVKKTVALLRDVSLTLEDRNLLTTALLDCLGALPVRARIQLETDGFGNTVRIMVDGQPLDSRKAARLGPAARSLQRNFAHKFVRETIDFMAIKQGVHFHTTPEQGLFAKAILWQHNEENLLVDALAGQGLSE